MSGNNSEKIRAAIRPRTHQIQSGDLLAWDYDSSKGWNRFIKKFIQFMTLSDYSHVGIAIVKDDMVYVFEALEPKIAISPIEDKGSFYVVPMNITDTTDLETIMQKYVGLEYSIVDCIRAYLGLKTDDNDSWQCAELATQVYRELGIEIDPPRLTPQAVVKASLMFSNTGLWIY